MATFLIFVFAALPEFTKYSSGNFHSPSNITLIFSRVFFNCHKIKFLIMYFFSGDRHMDVDVFNLRFRSFTRVCNRQRVVKEGDQEDGYYEETSH